MKIKKGQKTQKTYRFRLYPTAEQEQRLIWALDQCGFVYNTMLSWLQKQEKVDRYALQNKLPKLKEQYPKLKNVYSKVLQYEVHRLFSNLKILSQLKKKGRKVGKLRFKTKDSFKTIHYNQSGFKIISTNTRFRKLHLSKIGDIPVRIHRSINGKIKQIVIKKNPSRKWFACIVIEQACSTHKRPIRKVIGIDMGIKYFLSDSEGRQIENPHYLKVRLKRLRFQQKRLSRKLKNSNNWMKQKIKVVRLHENIVNQRDDYLHKLSRYYIDNYDIVAVEDLNIDNLVRYHNLAQSILDVSWYRFAQMLSYKAESASKTIVRVNPKNTSRTYKYGNFLDRDYNASLNILERALNKIGQGLPEFTPVKIVPPPEMKNILASKIVESGSIFKNH